MAEHSLRSPSQYTSPCARHDAAAGAQRFHNPPRIKNFHGNVKSGIRGAQWGQWPLARGVLKKAIMDGEKEETGGKRESQIRHKKGKMQLKVFKSVGDSRKEAL
eukprot:scaffold64305_cov30-Tisochrysis_lutea.AAC.1